MKAVTLLVMTTLVAFSTSEVLGGEQHFPQEVPWSGKPSDLAQRLRLQATVFPEFAAIGSFEEVIDHLRNEFRKHSRDGRSMGSFVTGDFDKLPKRLNIRLRGRSTLEVIDNLCALSGYNWTVAPHAIVINRPGAAAGKQEALFPHELPGEQRPGLSKSSVTGLTVREWHVETVFPEFKLSGTLNDAI